MDQASLDDRLSAARDTIADACAETDRDPGDVRIVAITKGHPAETIRAALESGLDEIGENRVGEALQKFGEARRSLDEHRPRRHMVGHLQRNKVRDAIALFDWIQSVDSLRLARALADRIGDGDPLPVLVEVDASGETGRHGFAPDEAVDRAIEIGERRELDLRGLMAMAPFTNDEARIGRVFGRVRRLFEDLRGSVAGCDTLSMGMSNDYRLAVIEGSTMVRLGTVLFGDRAGH